MLIAACSGDNQPTPTPIDRKKGLSDTLIGDWKLVKIMGGLDNIDKVPSAATTLTITLSITSGDDIQSFNYKFYNDTVEEGYFIDVEGYFVIMNELSDQHKTISPAINGIDLLKIYGLDNHFFIELDNRPLDGYCYVFQKINGGDDE
jgi:phosphotransferase system IIB component